MDTIKSARFWLALTALVAVAVLAGLRIVGGESALAGIIGLAGGSLLGGAK